MRYRLMATYLGVPYHAGLGPDGNDVTLFSPGPPPEELGFTAAPGHWRKQVSVTDLSALWQSRLVGEYRGEPCLVLDDLGERLHIVYLGRDAVRARQLGYWEIDREVFEVVVARTDVDGLTEERVEFPLSAAMFPSSNPAPPPAAGPLFDVFRPAGGSPPTSPEAEPETLIQGRLDAQGRVISGVSAEPTGPRTRMGPVPSTRSPAPPGYPGQGQGPRTTDRAAAWHGSPGPGPGPWSRDNPRPGPWAGGDPGPGTGPGPGPEPGPAAAPAPAQARARAEAAPPGPPAQPRQAAQSGQPAPAGRRTARKDRVSPQSVFAELLSLAGIPQATYAVDEEVPGAMCLVKAEGGFEVFSCTDDARLEVHFFEDEEAAYFYLFGVLAAEAIRSRRLGPTRPNGYVNGNRGPAGAAGAGLPGKTFRSTYGTES
ncbi:MAG: hypothetical protein ABSA53_09520 [Streptosporangiaceae bacterium]|jgi:hypothetical protein